MSYVEYFIVSILLENAQIRDCEKLHAQGGLELVPSIAGVACRTFRPKRRPCGLRDTQSGYLASK